MTGPSRVLMTADTVGGVWTYALELVQGLRAHGVQVVLATMGAPLREDQWQEARGLDNLTVCESNLKLEWMDEPWEDVAKAGDWLLELESAWQPEVVHLNGYVHGALPFRAPKLVVGHSCVLSWWEAVKGERAPESWNLYRDKVRRGLQAADGVVAPTGAMLQALKRHYGPLPRGRVIYNGRSSHEFRPAPKEPFILAAGRLWDEAKNIVALERVAPRLAWPVVVAGESRHPNGGSGRLEHVRALGRIGSSELACWLSRAAIYALPARYEPFGLSVLEAALSGCALVISDLPSLREVWGEAACYVPPDAAAALEAALGSLINDADERARMAALAYARAQAFTVESMAQAYLEAYKQLAAMPVRS